MNAKPTRESQVREAGVRWKGDSRSLDVFGVLFALSCGVSVPSNGATGLTDNCACLECRGKVVNVGSLLVTTHPQPNCTSARCCNRGFGGSVSILPLSPLLLLSLSSLLSLYSIPIFLIPARALVVRASSHSNFHKWSRKVHCAVSASS